MANFSQNITVQQKVLKKPGQILASALYYRYAQAIPDNCQPRLKLSSYITLMRENFDSI